MANKTGRRRSFGYVRKLPSGRFLAQYQGSDGRRYNAPVTYEFKADAEAYLATGADVFMSRSRLDTCAEISGYADFMTYASAAALLRAAESEGISSDEIDSILEAHSPCFDGVLCALCQRMEWEGEELLVGLAENPALSPEQQDRVFAAALEWQGRIVRVMVSFAGNRSVSEDVKRAVLAADEFIGYHVGDDLPEVMEEILFRMDTNPRFTTQEWNELDARAAALS